jgi:uncharacterized protein (DUF2141 family)
MKNRSGTGFFALLLLLSSSPGYSDQAGNLLCVKVTGATPGIGQAILSVFTTSENYLKKPLISRTKQIDREGHVEFKLVSIKTGVYAISIVYDKDNSGKLNTGLFGIPTELVGFSNNAKGVFGPPDFDDVSFPVFDAKTISIALSDAEQ